MDKDAVVSMVEKRIAKAGTLRHAAYAMGVSPPELSTLCQGNTMPSAKLLAALGLERVVTYRAIKEKA